MLFECFNLFVVIFFSDACRGWIKKSTQLISTSRRIAANHFIPTMLPHDFACSVAHCVRNVNACSHTSLLVCINTHWMRASGFQAN